MFEEIFFPRTAERYRAAPFVEQRERYLVHLKEIGVKSPFRNLIKGYKAFGA